MEGKDMASLKKLDDVWDVTRNGRKIDTVYMMPGSYDASELKRSLVNHDGYPRDITVSKIG